MGPRASIEDFERSDVWGRMFDDRQPGCLSVVESLRFLILLKLKASFNVQRSTSATFNFLPFPMQLGILALFFYLFLAQTVYAQVNVNQNECESYINFSGSPAIY